MDIKTFDLSDKDLTIGDVFTPLKWGEFAIRKFGLFEKWIGGATVFDPTMGEGNLLEALITYGKSLGFDVQQLPVHRLFGNELNTIYFQKALAKFENKYGIDMSGNFSNEDFLMLPRQKYDIIFGNPPWQNFVDLPESYKQQIKSYFFKYDLVGNSQSLLLGGSRIDISALIIQIAIKDFLVTNGEAVIFMPLSLLLNDGANRTFRTYSIDEVNYSVESVYDFNDEDVFGKVATRYGLSHFVRDKKASFPIPYYRIQKGTWFEFVAMPLFHETDPLSINTPEDSKDMLDFNPISIKKESSPRQGINTCGANEVFFFDQYEDLGNGQVRVSNKQQEGVILPKQFVYPLISSSNFKQEIAEPAKWVLLPYNKNGRPLEWKQILGFPALAEYLEKHSKQLQSRKGVMLNALFKRGQWWALLGVGEYCFFPYKIVWEAYGKTTFNPKIFTGEWQANQSLQAFIPLKNIQEADRILKALSNDQVEKYLLSLKMEGTMNWAQPGKIKKLVRFEEEELTLF